MAKLELGEWLPDLPDNENPGAILALNCLPMAKSYGPFNSLSPFSSALDNPCVGSFSARATSEAVFNFFGTVDKLFQLVGTTMEDVSGVSSPYSASFWDFVAFQNRVIATDGGGSDLQYFDMGSSTDFADLPGNPPRFKTLAVVRDFIVGGNYIFGGEVEPGGLAWSAFNNSEIWTPSLATQSNRIPSRGEGGQVQRIVPGAVGVILRETAILAMQYVGPPTVFKIDELIVRHGTPAPRSVCWTKDFIFYYSDEGFFQLNRKTFQVVPIGVNRVNEWFRANASQTDIVNMISAVRLAKNLVYWAFRSSDASPVYDRVLVFNYAAPPAGRWSYAVIDLEWLGEFTPEGANLDTLDAVLGSGGIDLNSIPVDTDAYLGGVASFVAFNDDHEAATLDGDPLVAEFDTTEAGLEDSLMFVNGVRAIVQGSPTSIQIAPVTRTKSDANPVIGSFVNQNPETGRHDVRVNARYQRYRLRITGGFLHAQRVEYEPRPRGRR